jgi:hypothetical protein
LTGLLWDDLSAEGNGKGAEGFEELTGTGLRWCTHRIFCGEYWWRRLGHQRHSQVGEVRRMVDVGGRRCGVESSILGNYFIVKEWALW